MRLTKSTFLDHRACPQSFWLAHRAPSRLDARPPGPFERMLARDGYEVERQMKALVSSFADAEAHEFQVEFDSGGFHARCDLVRRLPDGAIDLIEIKSSSSVKTGARDHRIDACYQTVVAELAGEQVRGIFIAHVDPTYVRSGLVEPRALMKLVDVTDDVRTMEDGILEEMKAALSLLAEESIDLSGCDCRFLGNAMNRCAGFRYLNPDIPEISAHCLPRISRKRLENLDAEGRLAMADVTAADVTVTQLPVMEAFHRGSPVVELEGLCEFLTGLATPLAFYDYESFGSAVPLADGLSPHSQIPVQFSVHVERNGCLEHHEHLAMAPGKHSELVNALREALPVSGSILVWNASYEKGCNKRLAAMLPEHADFLHSVNERTVDLMEPFKRHYVDHRFGGSTSIKKVLPVLCPSLRYDQSRVHDGAGAMEAWRKMVETDGERERLELSDQLFRYCALDSLAMVRILDFLRSVDGVVVDRTGP